MFGWLHVVEGEHHSGCCEASFLTSHIRQACILGADSVERIASIESLVVRKGEGLWTSDMSLIKLNPRQSEDT